MVATGSITDNPTRFSSVASLLLHVTELATLSTTDVADDPPAVAVVPTGSTEQHGPALPLGTDTIVATHFADVAAERDGVIRTPPVPVGVSPHHRHFDGSLWVGEETFKTYVEEIVRSLASHGIERIVLVNGHGGNVGALSRVGRRLRADAVAYAPTWNWWEAVDEQLDATFDEPGGHAGHGETSMLLAIDESLVESDRLDAAGEGAPPGWGKRVHGADVGFDTLDFTPTGAVGDPTAADAEIGESLRSDAADALRSLVDWLIELSDEELYEHARPLHPSE